MAALRLPDVIFVTLNYDLLLDERLARLSPLDSLDSYILEERNWALIKLHGSVNWARQLSHGPLPSDGLGPPFLGRAFDHVALSASPIGDLTLRSVSPAADKTLTEARFDGTHLYYPGLSVPLGPDDELSCPSSHVAFLKRKLEEGDRLHLLFIGYSGYDVAVMSLLRDYRSAFRSVTVVNPERAAGPRVQEGLGGVGIPFETLEEGFTAFVNNGHLEEVLARLQ